MAKEFVACQNDDSPGVLILSPFAGAGGLMHEALMVSYFEVVVVIVVVVIVVVVFVVVVIVVVVIVVVVIVVVVIVVLVIVVVVIVVVFYIVLTCQNHGSPGVLILSPFVRGG